MRAYFRGRVVNRTFFAEIKNGRLYSWWADALERPPSCQVVEVVKMPERVGDVGTLSLSYRFADNEGTVDNDGTPFTWAVHDVERLPLPVTEL